MKSLYPLRVLLASTTLGVILSGCFYFDRSPNYSVEERTIACLTDEAALIGTWQAITKCNWSWGDGCRTIPVEDRSRSLTFRDDGTCLWRVDDTLAHEVSYSVAYKENWLNGRLACLLEIGTRESHETWSIRFSGRDTLWLSLLANDAGSAEYVRIY